MNTNKIALMAIAVVAVGIFALPSTVSLFSGQHSWYGLDDPGSQVPCMKCHGDIDDEMTNDLNGVHRTLASPGCDCHRVSGTGVADGDGAGNSKPGTASHAAETIACMLCHENETRTGNITGYPFAGGFTDDVYNGTSATVKYNYSWGDDTGGERAAHNDFITESIKSDLMTDSNEACIACHTRIGVNITWRKSTVMHFDASEDHNGTWLLTDFTAHGYDYYNSSYENNWTKSY
jgi:hypothetical protein